MLDALRGLLQEISIHALREEGDASDLHKKRSGWYFYPRPPRGGRPSGFSRTLSLSRFLSTPSARRATSERRHWHIGQSLFLSTPSARRATTGRHPVQHRDRHFYPRPPRGGRPCHQCHLLLYFLFLSTPSARRATSEPSASKPEPTNFYPRPPRGGRPPPRPSRATATSFLSTPSARRATPWHRRTCWPKHISIHALREEGDCRFLQDAVEAKKFLSTPSARRATRQPKRLRVCERNFYPRPPRGGRP